MYITGGTIIMLVIMVFRKGIITAPFPGKNNRH